MGPEDELFQIDLIVAEEHLRLFLCHGHLLFQFLRRVDTANASAAAAGGCLDQYRIADLCGDALCLLHRGNSAVRAGDDRNAGSLHGLLGSRLVAQHGDGFRRRADEGNAVVDAELCKFRTLRQKAEARMQCGSAGVLAGGDEGVSVQVALLYRGRPDADGLIRNLCVQRIAVCGGVDRDALQPRLTAGTDDPHSDLTTVCN